jgi:hypothetical protein
MAEYTIRDTIFTLATLYDEEKIGQITNRLFNSQTAACTNGLNLLDDPQEPVKRAILTLLKKQGTQRNSRKENKLEQTLEIPNGDSTTVDATIILSIDNIIQAVHTICGAQASLRGFSKALSLEYVDEITEDIGIITQAGCTYNDSTLLTFPGGNLAKKLRRHFPADKDKYFLTDAFADELYPDDIFEALQKHIEKVRTKKF